MLCSCTFHKGQNLQYVAGWGKAWFVYVQWVWGFWLISIWKDKIIRAQAKHGI